MQKRRHARRCTRKGVEVIGSEEVVMARLGKRIKLKLLENHVRNRLKTEWLVGDDCSACARAEFDSDYE